MAVRSGGLVRKPRRARPDSADGDGVPREGQHAAHDEGGGSDDGAGQVLAARLRTRQDAVRPPEALGSDQLGHRRLRGGVVDGAGGTVSEHEEHEEGKSHVPRGDDDRHPGEENPPRGIDEGHEPSALEAVGDGSCGESGEQPRQPVSGRHGGNGDSPVVDGYGEERHGTVSEPVSRTREGEGRPQLPEPPTEDTRSFSPVSGRLPLWHDRLGAHAVIMPHGTSAPRDSGNDFNGPPVGKKPLKRPPEVPI